MDEIETLLTCLDTTKATGPDGISATMLKNTATSIAPIVTQLCNMSIRSGIVPESWKTSVIVPIHKQGDSANPGNYRPISLLPIISKVLERHILINCLVFFLSQTNSGVSLHVDQPLEQSFLPSIIGTIN